MGTEGGAAFLSDHKRPDSRVGVTFLISPSGKPVLLYKVGKTARSP